MNDLLKRWAKLEPQLCEDDGERITLVRDAGTPLARIWFGAQYHRLGIGIYEPLILAAVMEAIEARGLEWTIEHCRDCGHRYAAWTNATLPGRSAVADSAPEALLTAYLAALEAEAAK